MEVFVCIVFAIIYLVVTVEMWNVAIYGTRASRKEEALMEEKNKAYCKKRQKAINRIDELGEATTENYTELLELWREANFATSPFIEVNGHLAPENSVTIEEPFIK
jgi:hypothetical protein